MFCNGKVNQYNLISSIKRKHIYSSRTFGSHLDIHSGGLDLVFPHHANEILQSIKKKEPTYEEAYAVLNLVHAKLEFESNFVHVLSNVKI